MARMLATWLRSVLALMCSRPAAVLGPVPEIAPPDEPPSYGPPEVRDVLFRMVGGVDETVVLADQLLPGVLGDLAELVVDVGDPAPLVREGDDGRFVQDELQVRQLPEGPLQLLLGTPALGDVRVRFEGARRLPTLQNPPARNDCGRASSDFWHGSLARTRLN